MIRATAAGFLGGAALLFALHVPAAFAPPGAGGGPGKPVILSQKAEFLHRHGAKGVACAACHGDGFAVAAPDESVCATCHGDHAALAALTAGRFPNPHHSHMGPQACADCHSEHGDSRLSCNACHVFEMETP